MGCSAVTHCYNFARTKIDPPGVIDQRDQRPRWVGEYSFYGINDESLPLTATEYMEFGHTLEHFLQELLLANPALCPLFLAKTDISDGFYRIDLAPSDVPKLGLIFTQVSSISNPEGQIFSLHLVLPMGWKKFPPIFTTVTETVPDITNGTIHSKEAHRPHILERLASELDKTLVSTSLYETLCDNSLAEMLDINSDASTFTYLFKGIEHCPATATTPDAPLEIHACLAAQNLQLMSTCLWMILSSFHKENPISEE